MRQNDMIVRGVAIYIICCALLIIFTMCTSYPVAAQYIDTRGLGENPIIINKRDQVSDKPWLDEQVAKVGAMARSILVDVDRDNIIDCVDYSVTFKRAWDASLEDARCAVLVWHNKAGLNHMFVAVRRHYTSRVWYNIEPQAVMATNATKKYMVADYWPATRYNSIYNNYDYNSWIWTKALTNDWEDANEF